MKLNNKIKQKNKITLKEEGRMKEPQYPTSKTAKTPVTLERNTRTSRIHSDVEVIVKNKNG
jgi:hypothetical protein